MNNLYIIGNGFDLAHGPPTSYAHFAFHLYNNYLDDLYEFQDDISYEKFVRTPKEILEYVKDNVWDIQYDEVIDDIQPGSYKEELIKGFAGFLYYISDCELWSDFENSLGKIDYHMVFDNIDEVIREEIGDIVDAEGDRDIRWYKDILESGTRSWGYTVYEFKEVFREWIATVNVDKDRKKERFSNYLNENKGHFINFNYTETLQKVYGVQNWNVLHIHGFRNIAGDEIIVGHRAGEIKYESYITDYDENAYRLHEGLRKDVQLDELKKFLDDHENMDNIVCIGFSFGDSDDEYIHALIGHTKTSNATWVLNEYDKNEVAEQSRKLQKFGIDPSKITSQKIL